MRREVSQLSSIHPHPQHHSKQHFRLKDTAKSRQLETISLNHSEMKHLHAIRPYCPKNTKHHSNKHQQSPYEMSRSKSKRLDGSSRKQEQTHGTNKKIGDVLTELLLLKSQYKVLKRDYQHKMTEKEEEVSRERAQREEGEMKCNNARRQVQGLRKIIEKAEVDRDRLKKECFKVVQMERFRIKKLEETLQEKELMISFLRHENEQLKKTGGKNEGWQVQNSMMSYELGRPSFNISCLSHIPEESSKNVHEVMPEDDSLSLSRDKSKDIREELDSVIHSFLSSHDAPLQSGHNFMKKETIGYSLDESPISNSVEPIQQTSQPSEQEPQSARGDTQPFKAAVFEVEEQHRTDREVGWLREEPSSSEIHRKRRRRVKELQIELTDENFNEQNYPSADPSIDTKRRTKASQSRQQQQRKKTAKKKQP